AELLKQLGRNRRQCHRLGFRFARHTLSLGACYALNTKFLTGPILDLIVNGRKMTYRPIPWILERTIPNTMEPVQFKAARFNSKVQVTKFKYL
ncbi:hypothetical protein SB379_16480, partial [Burkholderia multivorans]|uniref:hypothetical protein n=1 Tax=Burkholderia multivorans TaxID=87883 RepID=UPI001B8E434F